MSPNTIFKISFKIEKVQITQLREKIFFLQLLNSVGFLGLKHRVRKLQQKVRTY